VEGQGTPTDKQERRPLITGHLSIAASLLACRRGCRGTFIVDRPPMGASPRKEKNPVTWSPHLIGNDISHTLCLKRDESAGQKKEGPNAKPARK